MYDWCGPIGLANGRVVFAERHGVGPPLLLLPGFGGDCGLFSQIVDILAVEFTVITFDRRGCSRSRMEAAERHITTPFDHAADSAALLAELELDRATVFGTGPSVDVALALAERHPERTRRLILHEPWPTPGQPQWPAWRNGISDLVHIAETKFGVRAAREQVMRLVIGDSATNDLKPDVKERLLSSTQLTDEWTRFGAYGKRSQARADLNSIPVDVLVGEEPPLPYLRDAACLLAQSCESGLSLVPGDQGAFVCRSSEFASALLRLLA